MTDRPTPETDAIEQGMFGSDLMLIADHARRLERERDEAQEALEYIAHAGLSARHVEDYAKEFLKKKEAAK